MTLISRPLTRVGEAKMGRRFKPGEICPVSGQWSLTDGTQATVTKGEPLPPSPRPRMGWKLTDRTR